MYINNGLILMTLMINVTFDIDGLNFNVNI